MNRGEICMKLLIIEDEADLRNALCKGFTKKDIWQIPLPTETRAMNSHLSINTISSYWI